MTARFWICPRQRGASWPMDRTMACRWKKTSWKATVYACAPSIRCRSTGAATLETLIYACHGDHRPDCPIIEELSAPGTEEPYALAPRRVAVALGQRR